MLQEIVQRYQDSHPGLPMVMGGVSMGGMVATLTVIRKQEMWKVAAFRILTAGACWQVQHKTEGAAGTLAAVPADTCQERACFSI